MDVKEQWMNKLWNLDRKCNRIDEDNRQQYRSKLIILKWKRMNYSELEHKDKICRFKLDMKVWQVDFKSSKIKSLNWYKKW